tara:strand:- start:606 stop:2777 length:2172 start_codon:yes stop_codon:yes gene_type:complete
MEEKNTKIDFVKLFIYFFILIITIFTIIIGFYIRNLQESYTKYKIILYFILTISYISLIQFPIRKLINKTVEIRAAPPGDKGPRGNRGQSGEDSICESCNGGDLCSKKILEHITFTYNWWREITGLPLKSTKYIINNEYLKSKIKKHCQSKEFSKILTKYGSNKKKDDCTGIDYDCGAYDYMFRMWTIWILIILKYDKGVYFLESESLNENDFINLLSSEVDSTIHNSWNHMFNTDEESTGSKNSDDLSINVKRNTKWTEEGGYIDTLIGVDKQFFKNNGVPDKLKTPFDEIKNYKAWYWGSDEKSKPILEIHPNNNYDNNDIALLCNSCINDTACGGGEETKTIKFKKTNNFYKLFTTLNSASKKDTNTNIHIPFQQYGELTNTLGNVTSSPISDQKKEGIIFMRPYEIIDDTEHVKYRHYKPVGDVVFDTKDVNNFPFESNSCLPNKMKYNDEFINKLVKHKELSSILVSGDTKSPTSYKLVYSTINRSGLNKNTAFSVWKPVPPVEYIALGYVIDTKPWENGNEPTKPSLDLIACVPKNTSFFVPKTDFSSIWKTNNHLDGAVHVAPPDPDTRNEIPFEIKKRKTLGENDIPLNTFITNDIIKNSNDTTNTVISNVGKYSFNYSNKECLAPTDSIKCFKNELYNDVAMSNLICEPYNPKIHNKNSNGPYNECSINNTKQTVCESNDKCKWDESKCKLKDNNVNNLKYSIYNIYTPNDSNK